MRLIEEMEGRALDAWRHGAPLTGARGGADDSILSKLVPWAGLAACAALAWAAVVLENSSWPA